MTREEKAEFAKAACAFIDDKGFLFSMQKENILSVEELMEHLCSNPLSKQRLIKTVIQWGKLKEISV
jgi:hypothetical protein